MLALLNTWANTNSGSLNLEGLDKQMLLLKENFIHLGGEIQELTLPSFKDIDTEGEPCKIALGKALHVAKIRSNGTRVFLGGHMDTVFGKHSPFQTTSRQGNDTLQGPGVADMKGGLVVLFIALLAFEKSPFANALSWEILINPDEELGSPGSRAIFERIAKRNHFGLLFEPSFADGAFVSERGGSWNVNIVVKGKAAHVGRNYHEGKSALYAIAPLIAALEALNASDVIINVGQLSSGRAATIVPDIAVAKVNVRTETVRAMLQMQQAVEFLIRIHAREGITITLVPATLRPPKPLDPQTKTLFSWLEQSSHDLGYPYKVRRTAGVSDGNILASYGLPTIDTLGPIGSGLHTHEEHIVIDSIVERAKLTALLLMKVANGEYTLPQHKAIPL